MTTVSERSWVAGLPKAEVHLHLEGCVPPELVGVVPPRRLASLPALLAHLDEVCGRVETPGQLTEIARQLSQRAATVGARHVDVIVNPTHWPRWRGRLGAMVQALDEGWREAEAAGGPTVGLCPSVSRRWSALQAEELVDEMVGLGHPRIVGLSIDGNEAQGSHNERFAPAFARAAAAGLRRCAHAGESSGPEGVREALELLGAERIDHGIRAVEDPALVEELAERAVPLDVCPTSNVVLGVVPSLGDHPIERLRRAGVPVSVNTDDPLLYGIDLTSEYERCATTFGWDRQVLAEVARTSLASCFAAPSRRAELLAELERHLAG